MTIWLNLIDIILCERIWARINAYCRFKFVKSQRTDKLIFNYRKHKMVACAGGGGLSATAQKDIFQRKKIYIYIQRERGG